MKRLGCFLAVLIVTAAFVAPARAQVGYGRAVAVGDGEVFIGEAGNRIAPGYVYVYRARAGEWVEAVALNAPDARDGDGFGQSLVVDGDLLFVGATGDEAARVHVFRRDGRGWTEIGRVDAGPDGVDESFGGALAGAGDLLLVGAAGADEREGAAYVYRRQGDRWVEQARLVGDRAAPDTEEADAAAAEEEEEGEDDGPPSPARFGSAVALHGDWAMVGSPGEGRGSGAVYVFRRQGDGWERVARLPEEGDAPEGASFGSSLLLRDGEALIGTTGAGGGVGAVHVYAWDEEAEAWSRSSRLVPFDGSSGTRFGSALAATDEEVFVGAPGADDGGRIYRFSRTADGTWTGADKVGAAGLSGRASFGATLALQGDLMVAGMPGDDYGAGTAMIMTRGAGGWDRTKVLSDVKSLDPITGATAECTDGMVGIFPCRGVDVMAYLPIDAIGGGRGRRANDIWGWTDPETGHDYAIIGLSDRASFVDVTDPNNPVHVGILMMTEGARGSVWRDMKVYADHVFIVSDSAGAHGMQVFDLARLREFEGEAIDFDEDTLYTRMSSAHNIVINEESAHAFIVGASGGGETCGGGLHMVNIEDPKNPAFVGCFADPSTGRRGTGYSHDAQCVNYRGPDARYAGREICFGANETALSVADVTDKRSPVAVGMASYPSVAYTHQGWLSDDHRYFYMNDEGDEPRGLVEGTRTIIWDVQELDDPIVVGEYIADVKSTDHNLYIVGDVMYQSNYDSGLRIFDISDRENIRPIGYLDTVPWGEDGEGGGGSWSNYPFFDSGVVVVTSMGEGLFVVKLRDDARADR